MSKNLSIPVRIMAVGENAELPTYQTNGSAGCDLRATEEVVIKYGEHKLLKTGLAVEIPIGYEAQIRSRSGLALKHEVAVLNSPGTIDSDYRGEIGVILRNYGRTDFHIKPGDRIAQLVFAPVVQADFDLVSGLGDTARGAGGFGSTGVST